MHLLDKHILDNPVRVKRLDPGRALESLGKLDQQIVQAWTECQKIGLPADYKKVNNVVISGMGGSLLGGHIVQTVFYQTLAKPIHLNNQYFVPGYVNQDTLHIVCSYSGGTEEALAALAESKKRGAKIFVITAGGELGKLVTSGQIAGYVFSPVANISQQPRLGVGYTLGAKLAVLAAAGVVKVSDIDIKTGAAVIQKLNRELAFTQPVKSNTAKQLALKLYRQSVIVVAAEHLAGNAHVWANQINETAKTLASYQIIPELNHHLLEGLKFPKANAQALAVLFLDSKLYSKKNQQRVQITKTVVQKNKVSATAYAATATTALSQALEMLVVSGYVTFYLAMLNNVNPNLIPWVDYFKEQLNKSR